MSEKEKDFVVRSTADGFEWFKLYASKFVQRFGLVGWDIAYAHADLEGAYAQVDWSMPARSATISFSREVSCKHERFRTEDIQEILHPEGIAHSAFHEVAELFLVQELSWVGDALRESDVSQWKSSRHAIIRFMENTIFPKWWGDITRELSTERTYLFHRLTEQYEEAMVNAGLMQPVKTIPLTIVTDESKM